MYEKFTDRARKVLQLANQEAQRFRHEYIGTEHILLGLIAEGSGVAANVLKNLEIDLPNVRIEIERIVQTGPDDISLGTWPQTRRAKIVLGYAIEEARDLGHNYVGTEHLLLGLVRETEGVASVVLMNFGLSLKAIRSEVLNILGHLPDSREIDPSTTSRRQNEEEPNPSEAPNPEIQHLPESAREIVAEFDSQIDVIKEEKEQAVGHHAFEKAAELRDLEYKLRKLRDEFISQWPKS